MSCVDKPEYAKKTGTSRLDAIGSMRRPSDSVSRPAREKRADDECHEHRVRGEESDDVEASIDADKHDAEQDPRNHVARLSRPTSASVPSAVPPMPRSWMMRASTGNAVTDIAAPRYIMLCQRDTLGEEETAVRVQCRRHHGAEQERRNDACQ